ncbi:protein of unknown function [Paraburkholderia kururiensis]
MNFRASRIASGDRYVIPKDAKPPFPTFINYPTAQSQSGHC